MTNEIKVGQTYRATVDGLQAKARWDSIKVGDVIYIESITNYGFTIQQVNGPAGGGLTLDELQLFERVGFHPNWNKVRQRLVNLAIEKKRAEFTKAKQLLTELPSAIIQLEWEHGQLKLELADLIQESKPIGDDQS